MMMQYNLEFCGMGLLPIVLHADADVAKAFCHEHGRRNKVLISVVLAGVWLAQWRLVGAVAPERVVV